MRILSLIFTAILLFTAFHFGGTGETCKCVVAIGLTLINYTTYLTSIILDEIHNLKELIRNQQKSNEG